MSYYDCCNVNVLTGSTLKSITGVENDHVVFETTTGEQYAMYHCQGCCENVTINDIEGDLNDLIGSPLLVAEEATNIDDPGPENEYTQSYTWTFYRFATAKGWVVIRWYGSSNGYYSEGVDFVKL